MIPVLLNFVSLIFLLNAYNRICSRSDPVSAFGDGAGWFKEEAENERCPNLLAGERKVLLG